MTHLFLTSDGRMQPRWREAFADAVVLAAPRQAGELPATAEIVWLSQDQPRYPALLAELHQSGQVFVVISQTPDQASALAALAAGARGYCHALATPDMLRHVAAAVSHGGLWVGPELLGRLIRSLPAQARSAPQESDFARLTERERETAQLVSQGLSNKEIARRLDITERTVKAHLSAIFAKLGLRDRLQLALRFGHGPGERP